MGAITGMIAPYKVAFSAEIIAINGIFRTARRWCYKPDEPEGQNPLKQDGIDTLSMQLRVVRL
jgi:hypothetical protein